MTETKHPYDQHDWRKESLTCDLGELEHVLACHIENAVPLEAVLRLPPEVVARILLSLRAQWHASNEVDAADYEEDEKQNHMNLRDALDAHHAKRETD